MAHFSQIRLASDAADEQNVYFFIFGCFLELTMISEIFGLYMVSLFKCKRDPRIKMPHKCPPEHALLYYPKLKETMIISMRFGLLFQFFLTSGLSSAFETLGRPRFVCLKNVVKTISATMPAVYTIGTPYTTAEKRIDGAVYKCKISERETFCNYQKSIEMNVCHLECE